MRYIPPWAQILGSGVIIAICVSWFLVFRPYTLGGAVAYIKVAGVSMQPRYTGGDLVITRRQDSYHVGDIIAFRVEDGIVIHRIVGGNSTDGYDTKGDNAAQLDGWRARPNEILGKAWLYVPRAGTVIYGLQQPAVLAALAGGLAAYLVMSTGGRDRRRRYAPALRLPGSPLMARSGAHAVRQAYTPELRPLGFQRRERVGQQVEEAA